VTRDLDRLASEPFDVLVVGAGIYGVATAWDAAQRGLKVALIDRGDFGGATSFNNAKTVHGGVRSLQRGHLRELRLYVGERRALTRIAPHLVHPLAFLVPTYGHLLRGRLATRTYFALYDALSADRNRDVDRTRQLHRSRLVSRKECLRLHPALADSPRVTGGILWYDCQMTSGERVTLAFVKSAARAGAAVANYVELRKLLVDGRRVVGASVRDRLGKTPFDIRARLLINATGPWANEIVAPLFDDRPAVLFDAHSLAMNLVVKSFGVRTAIGGQARGRLFFLAPWNDVTIAGTSHDTFDGGPRKLAIGGQEVQRLLDDLDTAFPKAGLTSSDVRFVHRGLLPASRGSNGEAHLLPDSLVCDHRKDGWDGIVSVVGVRYTTARHTAEQATTLACTLLGIDAPTCRTDTTPLAGGDIEHFDDYTRRVAWGPDPHFPEASRRRLVSLYGTEQESIRALARARPELAEPVAPGCAVTKGEIVYAVQQEMAVRLSDAVLRRTPLGAAGDPGSEALTVAAHLMGDELGWSAAERRTQIADVATLYKTPDL
jgi:glycerol-3-phosphate dehydrogenase